MALTEENWFQKWFGKDYLKVYSHRDQKDAKQLVRLIHSNIILNQNARILDIGCGQGRHLSLFAEKDYQITGIDLSQVLLKIAKQKNAERRNTFFIQADMRRLPLKYKFDLVLHLFTSFGYFEQDDENILVLNQIHELLIQNGNFVFDYFNSNYIKDNLVPLHKEKVGDLVVEQKRFIENSRVKKEINLIKDGAISTYIESVKLYSPDDIFQMLRSVNLKINKTFGNYDGSEFNEQSPRLIVFGDKIE